MTEAEFTALYQQYAPRLLRSARSILARYGIPEAQWSNEDAASVVWLEAWRHAAGGKPVNWTWLKICARDRAKNWVEMNSARPVCLPLERDGLSIDADEDSGSWLDRIEFDAYWRQSAPATAHSDIPDIGMAIASLPARYQEVLFFRLDGFNSHDLAEYYGIKLNDAEKLTTRSMDALKRKLCS